MQKFHHILFVSQAMTDETAALQQAVSIARNHGASLKLLILCPELPAEMASHQAHYESALMEQLRHALQATCTALKVDPSQLGAKIEVERGDAPAIRMIRHAIRGAHDLLIKTAEEKESGKGFKAVDMELLRQCPCPVLLSRPIARHRHEIRIAVAIDPDSMAAEGHDLSLRLLALSRALADSGNGTLHIISCWDYECEKYLQGNVWIKIGKRELKRLVADRQKQHREALDRLIAESAIGGALQIEHRRGQADQIIAHYVAERGIDLLVMGTVARTGMPGFVIGNTAENILQKLTCSLLALKPNGFISAVKAY